MKFTRNKSYIDIIDLNSHEILGFLKSRIESRLSFVINNEEVDHIILGDRTYSGSTNVISIKELGQSSRYVNYGDLISLIREKSKTGQLTIKIDINEFKRNESLISLIPNLRKVFIDNCIEISYNRDIFSIVNIPAASGESDKLFFFDLNNSVLLFSKKDGPQLIYNQFNSVEELLCE